MHISRVFSCNFYYFSEFLRREGGAIGALAPLPPPPQQAPEVHFFVDPVNEARVLLVVPEKFTALTRAQQ